jgi:hypothetical protein
VTLSQGWGPTVLEWGHLGDPAWQSPAEEGGSVSDPVRKGLIPWKPCVVSSLCLHHQYHIPALEGQTRGHPMETKLSQATWGWWDRLKSIDSPASPFAVGSLRQGQVFSLHCRPAHQTRDACVSPHRLTGCSNSSGQRPPCRAEQGLAPCWLSCCTQQKAALLRVNLSWDTFLQTMLAMLLKGQS